jgi:hypothetical protein
MSTADVAVMRGTGVGQLTGASVHLAGDIDDDQLADLIIGQPYNLDPDVDIWGHPFVLFGDSGFAGGDLYFGGDGFSADGSVGFRIVENDIHYYINTGFSIGSGDLDGDGLDEIIMGEPGTYYYGPGYVLPRVSVIFGAQDFTGPVAEGNFDILDLGSTSNGFVLGGGIDESGCMTDLCYSLFGLSVAAGDLNGDGLDDLIVAGPDAFFNGETTYGGASVIFGNAERNFSVDPLDLSAEQGFIAASPGGNEDDDPGQHVAFLGDINGDQIGDFAIVSNILPSDGGRVYVIFGREGDGVDVSLDSESLNGQNGFIIQYPSGYGYSQVEGNVDLNGDQIMDFVVTQDYEGSVSPVAHVIFGSESIGAGGTIDISALSLDGSNGFSIELAEVVDFRRPAVALGDVNGDGYADIVIGSKFTDTYTYGAVYVIFGLQGGEEF